MYELNRNKDITLSASVSCFNLYNLSSQLPQIKLAGIDLLHFDVVDGEFNDCIILGTPTLKAIRPHTDLPIEVHLAVEEPKKFIEQFVEAGADYIAVHYEVLDNPKEIFEQIFELGARPLLAFRAETEIDESDIDIIKNVDWVIKLTVNPGYSGQQMKIETIEKIKNMRELFDQADLDIGIQADGNINPQTIPKVVAAGADILTGGTSGLFLEQSSIGEAADKMRSTALKAKY